jgi:hypothetical protein
MEIASDTAVKLVARGSSAEGPIIFAGSPALLEAEAWLHNDEREDLRLRRATLISSAVPMLAEQAEVARLTVPRVVLAGQRKLLSMSFDLDPSIPPGTYDAEIRLEGIAGSKSFFAWIIVARNYQLSLEPDQFVFPAGAGSRITAEMAVWNEGNVPIEVTPMGEYRLEDANQREPCPCCGARHERKRRDDEDFGCIVISNDTFLLQPGTWALVKFTAQMPDSLPPNAHLRARPRVGNERFDFDILTPVHLTHGHGPKPRSAKNKEKA